MTPNAGYDLGAGDNEEVTLVPSIDESLNTTDNSVEDLSATAGQIVQDGVRLQTPLVQLAGGDWLARLVISNTGTKDRTFVLKAQTEDGNSVTVPNTVYTVKAGKTYVFENLGQRPDLLGPCPRHRGRRGCRSGAGDQGHLPARQHLRQHDQQHQPDQPERRHRPLIGGSSIQSCKGRARFGGPFSF
ncbi:hypothetical protein H1235_03495 [Pseudoxanthomonas sp. NC8]|nr:hypothetical protein H1235_03495 [Pseudoxanthomonas sp. NC8]